MYCESEMSLSILGNEIQTNDSQLHEFEVLKLCLNNNYVSVNRCWKAEGLSEVLKDIE